MNTERFLHTAAAPGKDVLNLAIGAPDVPPHPELVETLRRESGVHPGYSDIAGLSALRDEVKKHLHKTARVRAEEALVTAGAVEAVFDTLLAHARRGEALLLAPCYPKYAKAVAMAGAGLNVLSLPDGKLDLDALSKALSAKTRLVVLNSPNNPTGVVQDKQAIQALAELAEEKDFLILSDEVYAHFVFGKAKHHSPARFSDRVLVAGSASKCMAFPALRVGWLAGTKELIEPVASVHLANTTCVPEANQQAALLGLQKRLFVDRDIFAQRLACARRALEAHGLEALDAQGALYMFVKVNQDPVALCQRLEKKGVLLLPGTLFHASAPAVRISLCAGEGDIERGITVLAKAAGR